MALAALLAPEAAAAGTTAAGAAGTSAAMTAAPSVFTPGLAGAVGGNLGLDVPLSAAMMAPEAAPVAGMSLSEGLKGATGALQFASKLTSNKKDQNMLNLMSMATGAGENAKDPKALMKSMAGPMESINANITSEEEGKKKRLSEMIPSPTLQAPQSTPATPTTGQTGTSLPATRLTADPTPMDSRDRLRGLRGF